MPNITEILLLAPPVLFAITVHEYSHGYVADRLGDPTARLAGRLTLNPLAHLDPIGTIMFFLIHMGWAKPVPVDARYFKNPKNDMIWVSLAGPGANMLVALGCGIIIRYVGIDVVNFSMGSLAGMLKFMLLYGVIINLVLAGFNLIPIPPLDGSKILMGLLPPAQAYKYSRIEPYGWMILMGLILMDSYLHIKTITLFIGPFVNLFSYLFTGFNIGAF
jgi:Zn-dependent protease